MNALNIDVMPLLSLGKYRMLGTSMLYSLEPLGIGTPLVEGLTSYIARLSLEHSVSILDLLAYYMSPNFTYMNDVEKNLRSVSRLMFNGYKVNGYLSLTKRILSQIEDSTNRSDIDRMTMLSWENTISFIDLFHRNRRWCPICYNEYRISGNAIYDPLIWSVSVVNTCYLHKNPLVDTCSVCGESSRPLTSRLRPGYCTSCNSWLGLLGNDIDNELRNDNDAGLSQMFVHDSLGYLVPFRSSATLFPRKENISKAIVAYSLRGGKMESISRLKNISQSALHSIYSCSVTPTLLNILKICSFFQVSLLQMLTASDIDKCIVENIESGIVPIDKVQKQRVRPFIADRIEYIKSEMVRYSQMPNPPSLSEIAMLVGCDPATIKRYSPDEAKIIINRNVIPGRIDYLESEIKKVFVEDPPPTQKQVVQRLKMKRSEKRMFANELKLIAAQWLEHRKTTTQNKLQEKIQSIYVAVQELYQQGVFPTQRMVYSRLGWDYVVSKNTVLRRAWENAVRELQYYA